MTRDFKTNNFDLLRIVAATQVVLAHSVHHLGLPKPPGWWFIDAFPGVPIFFAISGYLISASYERNPALATYGRNRLLRIYPGLWSCVLLTVGVACAFGYSFLTLKALAWLAAQLCGLIYTPGFLRSFGFGSYNGALWTIPIELQFYVVLPVLYAATRNTRNRTALFAVAWALFVAVGYAYARSTSPLAESVDEPLLHKLYRYSFVPHIYMFLTGVLLQRWRAHASPWIAGKGAVWLLAYLAIHRWAPWTTSAYILGTLMMAVTVISIAYTLPGLGERLLRGNDISYGVYIYHGLVLNVLLQTGHRGRWGWLWLTLALTYVIAFASWKRVEKPFLKRKKNAMHPAVDAPPHGASP